jgi:ABC-type sugar transport system substrate-binding protein
VPLDVPQQESHRAYIRTAVAALEAAGVPVVEVEYPADDADLILLRRAWLVLGSQATARVYGKAVVAVLWDEEDGWALGWGPNCDNVVDRVRICKPILADVLEVVTAVRAGLAALPSPVTGEHRDHERYDDAFELTLDAYTFAE